MNEFTSLNKLDYRNEKKEILKKTLPYFIASELYRFVYLDHSATTYIKKEVLQEMMPYLTKEFGNPSSIYPLGKRGKIAIENSREKVAKALNCKDEEIFFTSCGTEANNFVLKGISFANKAKGNHIITSSIEHPSVINSCKYLEKHGFRVTYLPVDQYGTVSINHLKQAITDKTILISVMTANNEIGTIQPIKQIGKIAYEKGIYFHTDAVQAIGNVPIDTNKYHIDMLSLSAHKFYGPKGIGAIYIRDNLQIEPFMHGGKQENYKRAGTENVASIVGLGRAIEIANNNINEKNKKVSLLRNIFMRRVLNEIDDVKLNGHATNRLSGNVNLSFKHINGSKLAFILGINGVAVSTGSACSCKSNKPSYVLTSIGLSPDDVKSSLRFTFGEENTEDDIDYVMKVLSLALNELKN